MLLTEEIKRAMRRRKGEENMTLQKMASSIGLHYKTVERLLGSLEPVEVRKETFEKITNWLAKAV
jgi:hypothetical protein